MVDGGVVGSGGGAVVGGGGRVVRGRVSRMGGRVGRMGRGVRPCLVVGGAGAVVGLAGVGDVGDVAGVRVVHVVGHRLRAAVGEEDGVGSAGGVPVALLVLAELGAAVLVVHAVLEGVVRLRRLGLVVTAGVAVRGGSRVAAVTGGCVMRGRCVVRCAVVGRGDGGSGEEEGGGGEDRGLKDARYNLFATRRHDLALPA